MTKWEKCYDEGWKDLIVPEAFSHPAKMSYGLLKRILDHAKDWLNEGDVIVDPFGGIGSTGILGAYEGYQVVCVELERKFVDLANKNFELHKDAWVEFDNPFPIILQGDSRRLCEDVEKADCIVSSPPYSGTRFDGTITKREQFGGFQTKEYGRAPGQLGNMKLGKVDMVVSSPPYAKAHAPNTSPNDVLNKNRKDLHKSAWNETTQGQTNGNLGNLKAGDVDCVISSPPYEDGLGHGGGPCTSADQLKRLCNQKRGYGETKGQIENLSGDTFWSAAKIIIEQCFQILKPGGHAIWVTKSFVRNKKIVDFPGDWLRFCESTGFKLVCRHRAMLVKEKVYKSLFGGDIVKTTERKSFFRRLAEAKGSPRIDWEDVICMEK